MVKALYGTSLPQQDVAQNRCGAQKSRRDLANSWFYFISSFFYFLSNLFHLISSFFVVVFISILFGLLLVFSLNIIPKKIDYFIHWKFLVGQGQTCQFFVTCMFDSHQNQALCGMSRVPGKTWRQTNGRQKHNHNHSLNQWTRQQLWCTHIPQQDYGFFISQSLVYLIHKPYSKAKKLQLWTNNLQSRCLKTGFSTSHSNFNTNMGNWMLNKFCNTHFKFFKVYCRGSKLLKNTIFMI